MVKIESCVSTFLFSRMVHVFCDILYPYTYLENNVLSTYFLLSFEKVSETDSLESIIALNLTIPGTDLSDSFMIFLQLNN